MSAGAPSRAQEISLLGGSFNPPHFGHLTAALYARAVLGADEVWLVPSFHHPFGKALAPFEDRLALCAALGEDVGPWFRVSRAEAEVGGEGRTIELLEHLLPRHPGVRFRFLIGSDIVGELAKWRAWERIERLVEVTVLHRAGFPVKGALGPPMAEVSSTEIRERLAAGADASDLVPRGVLRVIQARGLYGVAQAEG